MKRKSLAAALSAAALLSVCVYADFAKSKTYREGQYADVPAAEWYAEPVKDAFEFGIMQGDSATTFNPTGTLTAAEAITTADRIFAALKGVAIDTNVAGEWYIPYVRYAIDNGIMTDGMFDDYDAVISRGDMARLLAAVCGDLPKINDVKKLPDVPAGALYTSSVLKLYNAGILTGNDGYGSFAPASDLERCEMAAMAVRIADASKRIRKTFDAAPARTFGDAYGIIECILGSGRNGIANGWNYDNRFDLYNTAGSDKNYFLDASDERYMRMLRDFDPEDSGILNVEMYLNFGSRRGGGYIAFRNAAEQNLIEITERGGRFVFKGTNEVVSDIACPEEAAGMSFILRIDLDYNTASLIIDNTAVGTVDIDENAVLQRLVLGSRKEGEASITLTLCKMNKNYVVADRFLTTEASVGAKPVGWDIAGDFDLRRIASELGQDVTSVRADSKAGSVSTAKRAFEPVNGNVDFETFVLLPKAVSGASFAITSGGNDVIRIETKGSAFYCGDLKLRDYTENVWQNLHVEANTATGKALIKIDGKEVGTVDFNADYFDGCTYTFAPDKDAVMWFDDLDIYCLVEHDDYPSAPISAQTDDYNIGINFCWLWRDQNSGEGWDSVSPFAEFDPYLGYYDEGLREVADWEIKWMVEHGIDFIHACWYSPNSVNTVPVKRERVSYQALHDGFMNAKYSDRMQFCIMWENNYKGASTPEQFKEYLWKYWKEYYFTDPRYARLDNKAVFTIWNYADMLSVFGGESGAKEMIKWMEEDLRSIGYDGLILLFCNSGVIGKSTLDTYASLGAAGTYAYSYAEAGMSGAYQISCNTKNAEASANSAGHHIPTISIGFNDVGRNETRDPVIPFDEHKEVCENVKELLAATHTGTWQDNTLFVSTWNEYSEGTYVFPCRQNGFNYLENIRQTFGNTSADKAVLETRPTQNQIDRCSHLYPANHAPIRWLQFEPSSAQAAAQATGNLIPMRTYDMSGDGIDGWKPYFSVADYSEENGVISGRSQNLDFAIQSDRLIPFDAETAPVVHIRMKSSEPGRLEVFFMTAADPEWNAKRYKYANITKTDEFVDYYIDMTGTGWVGSIVGVRIDPGTIEGEEFAISLIEFMRRPSAEESNTPEVSVNGTALSFTFDPAFTADGDIEVVGEARKMGFYSMMQLYHEWDRFTGDGVLTLYDRADNRYVFTVGEDTVLVNGESKPLGYTFTLHDGLPVFRLKKLCDLLGYPCETDGVKVNITSCSAAELKALGERKPGCWEFDEYGDEDGFSEANGTRLSRPGDGTLYMIPANTDPQFSKHVSFNTADFTHLVLGVRYADILATQTAQFFFVTADYTDFAESLSVVAKYDMEGKKPGDTVEAVFDLRSNRLFTGKLTSIRIDPIRTDVPLHIDYIRFENRGETERESPYIECDDENQWYFDTDGDVAGWTPQSVREMTVGNGALTGAPDNKDPAVIHAVSFTAADYQTVRVGIRYFTGLDAFKAQLFFVTGREPAWSEAKSRSANYSIPSGVKEGDTVEVIFDLSDNVRWAGDITGLRFDMFNDDSPFEIDYIRLGKVKGYVPPTAPEPEKQVAPTKPTEAVVRAGETLPDGIYVTCTGGAGELAIVEDPEDKDHKVFAVNCTRNEYTYLNVFMQFEAGVAYDISYSLYPLTDKDGNNYFNTVIGGNLRYKTTTEDIKDHPFATPSDRSTGDGWIEVNTTVAVPEDYSASDADCFQTWGRPVGDASIGVSYLVGDISITKAE